LLGISDALGHVRHQRHHVMVYILFGLWAQEHLAAVPLAGFNQIF